MKLPISKIRRTFVLLGIFSIAMGFLEAIVVVYIRELYYPQGFEFPLNPLASQMFFEECLREITTIVMLVTAGMLAGKNYLEKFSFFLYTFAVWDIFYYVALKLLLNWPDSFFTWDILFLIPVVWVGPVLAPILCSLTMVILAGVIVRCQEQGDIVDLKAIEWGLLFLGAGVILCTFIWDYSTIILQGGFLSSFWTLLQDKQFQKIISAYIPVTYNWYLFAIGEILVFVALVLIHRRARSNRM